VIKLPDWKDPIIFTLLVALAICAVLAIAQRVQLGNARERITALEGIRDTLNRDIGVVETQRDEAVAKNSHMSRRLDEQSQAIAQIKTQAEASQAKAGAAARVVLAERPKLPAGHGPAVMNAWLRDTFSSR